MEENYTAAAAIYKSLAWQASKESQAALEISFYINAGNAFTESGLPDSAMLYFGKALELAKEINDRKQELAALTNIGTLFSKMDQYDSAAFYLRKSGKLASAIGRPGQYAIIS